jgi:hypothetical protein
VLIALVLLWEKRSRSCRHHVPRTIDGPIAALSDSVITLADRDLEDRIEIHGTDLIATIAIALGAAFVAGYLARLVGLPSIVGYLLAGVAVSPFTPRAGRRFP